MLSHKTGFTELVSSAIRQSVLHLAFTKSFMRTCLFSCFLRTLALISIVSYKSFPSTSVMVHNWLLKASLKDYEREVGAISAYFGIVYFSSCVWNLFDGVGFTPVIFTSDLFRYVWFRFVCF